MGVRRNPQRGTWQLEVRYTLRGRLKRVRKDFSTKAEADKAHRKLKEDIKRLKSAEELGILPADEDAVAPASTTLTSWWASWIDVCEAEGNRPACHRRLEAEPPRCVLAGPLLPASGCALMESEPVLRRFPGGQGCVLLGSGDALARCRGGGVPAVVGHAGERQRGWLGGVHVSSPPQSRGRQASW